MAYAMSGAKLGEAKAKTGAVGPVAAAKPVVDKPGKKSIVKKPEAGKGKSLTAQGRAPKQRTPYE